MIYFEDNKILNCILPLYYQPEQEEVWNKYSAFSVLKNLPFLDKNSFLNLCKKNIFKFYKIYNSYLIGVEQDSFFIVLYYVVNSIDEFIGLIRHINQYDDAVFLMDLNQYLSAKTYIKLGYKIRFKKFVNITKNRKIAATVDSTLLQAILPTLTLPYTTVFDEIQSISQ